MRWLKALFGPKQGPPSGCIAANPKCRSKTALRSICAECGDDCYRCEKCGAVVPGSCRCKPGIDSWYVR